MNDGRDYRVVVSVRFSKYNADLYKLPAMFYKS